MSRLARALGRASVLVALSVFFASPARARDQWDSLFGGELAGGLGTPLGFVGVDAGVYPIRWLGITAGVGVGYFGVEGALALRPRIIARKMAFGFGLGASMGPYGASAKPWLEDGPTYTKRYDYVAWLTGEFYIERRGDGPPGWRLFFGGSHPVATGRVTCSDTSLERDVSACNAWKPVTLLPYMGASVEWF